MRKVYIILYVFIFVILSSLAFGEVIDSHNITLTTSEGIVYSAGVYILPNFDVTLNWFEFDHSTTDATNCLLVNSSADTLLKNVSIVGFNCSMNYDLTAGEEYVLAIHGSGAWTRHYETGSFPYDLINVNITGGADNNARGQDDYDNTSQLNCVNNISTTLSGASETSAQAANITLLAPANKSSFIYSVHNLSYNTTCDDCVVDSCSLMINDIENSTNNTITNATESWFRNVDFGEGSFNWTVNCTDNNTNHSTTENFTLHVDATNPIIIEDETKNNQTVIYDIFSGQINATDNNLYRVSVLFDGGMLNNDTDNVTGIDITLYQFNWSYNLSGNASGVHNLTFEVCDGHTAKELKGDYKVSDGLFNNMLSFEVYDKNTIDIIPKDGSIFDSMSAEKKEDRYTFKYEPNDNTLDSYTFEVSSDSPIDIVKNENTIWKEWLVTGDHWIDFYIDGSEKVTYKRIDSFNVEVTVSNLKDKTSIQFNSIGDLNCVEETYLWYKYDYNYTFTENIIEGTNDNITFNISTDTNYITNVEAILTYNDTEHTPTKDSVISGDTRYLVFHKEITTANVSLDTNITLYWNYTITGGETLRNKTLDELQQVNNIGVGDCTDNDVPAINFSILSETNRTYLRGDIEYTIDIEYNDVLINQSGNEDNVTNFSICISPSDGNYSADLLVQYVVADHDTRDWIKEQYTLDNETDFVDLFALTSGTSTAVDIHVKDENEDDLEDVQIEASKFYIENNSYEVVSIESTDSGGDAQFNLEVGSTYYQFRLYQNGELKLTTDTFKITDTALEYTISSTVGDHPLVNWLRVQSISRDLSFTNSSNTFIFTYNDTNDYATEVCMEINDGETTYFSNCNTSTASTMSYQVTVFNTSYTAIATATVGGSKYTLDVLSINLRDFWRQFGVKESIMYAMIIFLIITLIGIKSPQIASGMAIVALIALYALRMIPAGLTAIIGICVVGVIMIILMRERYYQ